MAIKFSGDSPKDTHEELDAWIPQLQKSYKLFNTESDEELFVSDGYLVKYLMIDTVADGKLYENNIQKSWRHLLTFDEDAHGEIELDENLKTVALHQGSAKDGLMQALHIADEKGDFEAEVLVLSALGFTALRLFNEKEIWVIPYPPNLTDLTDFKMYSEEETLQMLRPLAQKVQEMMNETDDPIGG